jgi:eukaryotic-like serine/threonine-protein kinase
MGKIRSHVRCRHGVDRFEARSTKLAPVRILNSDRPMTETPTAPTLASRCRTPDLPLAAGTQVGDWTIAGIVGTGGMATVYSVTDDLGNRAALKLAHKALIDAEFTAETFLREARIARRVSHLGAVGVKSTGTHDGRPYLVEELFDGSSLGERLDGGMPLPRPVAFGILLELVEVLRAAHTAGVVHRDLKPDNIFLLAPPSGRRVKLLDWGVAHVAGEPDPFRGMIAGTLTYVAPEQIRGDAITSAADVYSLGVLAFRLLCSWPPFAASSDIQLLKLHLHTPPPRASTAWPAIPAELDELLLAMLDKTPERRPGLDEIERVVRTAQTETKRKLAFGTMDPERAPIVTVELDTIDLDPVEPERPARPEPAVGKPKSWLQVVQNLFTILW